LLSVTYASTLPYMSFWTIDFDLAYIGRGDRGMKEGEN